MDIKKAICDLERTILRQHMHLARYLGTIEDDKCLLLLHRVTTRTLLVNLEIVRRILERERVSNMIGGGDHFN